MNIILGSGLIGLICKEVLGADWKVIPFGKSRLYSFQPSLGDNYIVRDERIDDLATYLGGSPKHIYTTKYSAVGSLYQNNDVVNDMWASKTFGNPPPPHVSPYLKNRDNIFIYDLKANIVYNKLLNKYETSLKEEAAKGKITEIKDGVIKRGDETIEYDKIVSTVPLSVLDKLMGTDIKRPSKQVWYYHIATDTLDFEGANQVLVADQQIAFYKVNNIAKNRYLFYCVDDIPTPGPYFMQFMPRLDILDGTTIEDGLPTGDRPNLQHLENKKIYCIGAYAQWDWCMDIGSCMIRLLKLKEQLQ